MTNFQDRRWRSLTRRDVLKGTSAAALALAFGPAARTEARQTPPTRTIKGTQLSLLQWTPFVPRHDVWFDKFAQDWGAANEVEVTVDHINTADIRSTFVSEIKQEQGIQLGVGMSNETDSNMAAQALLWCFNGAVQDAQENVVINTPETVAAVEYMVKLYEGAMTHKVFAWNAASNNLLLIGGQASYILNSISAYRSAQTANPEVAPDIHFVPALKGPTGIALANAHALVNDMIPKHAKNPDTVKEFLLRLIANDDQAVRESELCNFPAWSDTSPAQLQEGGLLDNDPFGSEPPNKLAILKTAEEWTTNLGDPGPTNATMGEVFGTWLLPGMMAKAAQKEMTPQEAVADAETKIKTIAEKWRAEGLVGGGQ